MHTLLHSVPPVLQQGTTDPCLCQRLLDTHGQVWVNLLWGHCSFLLGSGVHKILFVLSKSRFPQSCVNSGGSMVGLMATSFKRSHACTFSAPSPPAGHCQPTLLPETPGHLRASPDQSPVGLLLLSPGSWYAQGSVFSCQEFVSQACVSSGSSLEGLMAISSKRAYAIPRSAVPRAPAPVTVHC